MNRVLSLSLAVYDVIVPKILSMVSHKIRSNLWYKYKARTMPSKDWNMPQKGFYKAERVLVYHEANNAGPHLEQYIVKDGQANNIGVKRLKEPLSKGRNGRLTIAAKDQAIEILKREFTQRGFIAGTTDHTEAQAKCEWLVESDGPSGYGAGKTRQVVSTVQVQVHSKGNKVMYTDWEINPDQQTYIFQVFPKHNILATGFKMFEDPDFADRLHLKLEKTPEEFTRKLGPNAIYTEKIDGASCHFRIDEEGFRAWSSRFSKETGHRIEYTSKLGELALVSSDTKIIGMGELTYRATPMGSWWLSLPKECSRTLSAAEIGGILNANRLPEGVTPNLMVYRIDSIGGKNLLEQPYELNLKHCQEVASKSNLMSSPVVIADAISYKGGEGLVGVASGQPISLGRKYKLLGDSFDWTLTSVDLKPGDKGGVSGVVWFKNAEGKKFKLGANGIGTREQAISLMNNPAKYIGNTYQVSGLEGHEGRSARLVYGIDTPHLDK